MIYGWASPTEVPPVFKSQKPRTQTDWKHVKTRVLTDRPEKQSTERAHEETENKQRRKESAIEEPGGLKRKQSKKRITAWSSSEESDVPIAFDDSSERESSNDERIEPDIPDLLVADFVIVNLASKYRGFCSTLVWLRALIATRWVQDFSEENGIAGSEKPQLGVQRKGWGICPAEWCAEEATSTSKGLEELWGGRNSTCCISL